MKPFFVKLTMAIAIGVLSTAAGAKNLGKFYCGECGVLGQDLETLQQFIQGLGLKDKAGNPYKPQTLVEILLFHVCRRHYPGGTTGVFLAQLSQQ
jgi:hypothetical protein